MKVYARRLDGSQGLVAGTRGEPVRVAGLAVYRSHLYVYRRAHHLGTL